MLGTFLVPLLDLAFHHSWIPAVATRSKLLPTDFAEQSLVPFADRVGRRFVQMALEYTQGVGERQPVGIELLLISRIGDHLTNHAMGQEQSIEFLNHTAWGLAAQKQFAAIQVRLDFIEREFRFPAIMPPK